MIKQLMFIALGGGIGSVLRYLAQIAAIRWMNRDFPAGTFAVNLTGCFLIGLFYAWASKGSLQSVEWRLFLITGICGGYTTFSSFSYENVMLLRQGHYLLFAFYAGSSVVLGLLGTIAGMAVGK